MNPLEYVEPVIIHGDYGFGHEALSVPRQFKTVSPIVPFIPMKTDDSNVCAKISVIDVNRRFLYVTSRRDAPRYKSLANVFVIHAASARPRLG